MKLGLIHQYATTNLITTVKHNALFYDFMTIFKVPIFGYLLNLKHLYYYALKNILAIHQYFVFWFLNLYGKVQKY